MSAFGNGKVILLGEHAVVHGVAAIAAGLRDGARAALVERRAASLHVAPWNVTARPDDGTSLGAAFSALLRAREDDRRPSEPAPTHGHIEACVALPGSAGLGSSAALAVALLRALDIADGIERDFARSQAVALAWERVFHGNPSGIDTALALVGGLVRYRRSAGSEPSLVPLSAARPLTLVVGQSGEPGSTRAMVERVATHRGREGWDEALADIEALVRCAEQAIVDGALDVLGNAMGRCHERLAAWGVSTPRLDAMCERARAAGALGAKLTGGGGGGCMIALVASENVAAQVADALARMGCPSFSTTVGGVSTEAR